MPDLSYSDIVFKPLDAYDDVSSFHSTEQELDDFLKEDALNNQTNRLSATFLACWDDELAGYFTLINDSLVAEAVHELDREPSSRIPQISCHKDRPDGPAP